VLVQDQFLISWKKAIGNLPKSAQVIVAVSGGVDSMVLLHLVREVWSLSQITVAHFDHKIRPSSGDVSRWLQQHCTEQGFSQFVLGKRTGNKTSEEALRNERYEFLKKAQTDTGASIVLLAHHANDQLETFLMRLLRGSGVHGLSSMAGKNGVFVRPLLKLSKAELSAFAQKHEIPFREDETNQETVFFRNQIRNELTPKLVELSARYGGEKKFLERLGLLTDEIQDIRRENKKSATKWVSTHFKETLVWHSFSRIEWLSISNQIKKTVALKLWRRLANETLETKELKLLDEAIQKQKTVVLSGDIKVMVSCGVVYLITPKNQTALEQIRREGPAWEIFCRPGKERRLKELLGSAQAELRFLEPGDKFNRKKMKRRCLEQSIPLPERLLLPVVAKKNSKDLLWYYPLSDVFLECVNLPWAHGSSNKT
jgi:tRNA(Ile)-lysidine synthetase-like protein